MLKNSERPHLYMVTTKLKRYKVAMMIPWVLLSPILLIAFVFFQIGRFAEAVVDWLGTLTYRFTMKLVQRYRWNDVAIEQRKTNPAKFKK